ncbi:hypothetical protein BGZ47_011464 [Haplosporangium gracile]|nr:hypothetical protein BGZ47_011464 [Haplosporangium gracile]
MICEQCYKMARPASSFLALPVVVIDAIVSCVIRMCRDCSADYYFDHLEPVLDDVAAHKASEYTVRPRMTEDDTMKIYLLSDSNVMSLPYKIGRNLYFGSNSPMYLFEEQRVLRLAYQYAGRKIPEPHDDVVKHRRNLLRSMLYDNGLYLPEHAAMCNIYIETGLKGFLEIIQQLKQVKRRSRINRRRITLLEGESLMSANSGGVAVQSIQDEVMTEEVEEEDDHHMMAALDDWLTHRLEQGQYRNYNLDPEGPARPPKAIWSMLDKNDMTHKMLEFAAGPLCHGKEEARDQARGRIR